MQEMEDSVDRQTEIRHLLRTVKTSLELAIIARAPVGIAAVAAWEKWHQGRTVAA